MKYQLGNRAISVSYSSTARGRNKWPTKRNEFKGKLQGVHAALRKLGVKIEEAARAPEEFPGVPILSFSFANDTNRHAPTRRAIMVKYDAYMLPIPRGVILPSPGPN